MKLRKPAYFPYGESPMNVSVVGLPVMRSSVVYATELLEQGPEIVVVIRGTLTRMREAPLTGRGKDRLRLQFGLRSSRRSAWMTSMLGSPSALAFIATRPWMTACSIMS
jgi:hypothetical protein